MEHSNANLDRAIAELEKEIADDEVKIAAKKGSLEILRVIIGKMTQNHAQNTSYTPSTVTANIVAPSGSLDDLFDLSELTGSQSQKRTLTDDVKDVITRFGAQEFTIAHVEGALKKIGVEVTGKSPRTRISVSLANLADENFVMRTFKGAGNTPNRYRVRSQMTEAEIRDAVAKDMLGSMQKQESQEDLA